LREWLPEDHFPWFVIAVVDGLDLTMMVALLVYAYAIGERSSQRGAGSVSGAHSTLDRSRAHAPSDGWRPAADCTKSLTSSNARTPITRPIEHAE
jgi:hypothetical protein